MTPYAYTGCRVVGTLHSNFRLHTFITNSRNSCIIYCLPADMKAQLMNRYEQTNFTGYTIFFLFIFFPPVNPYNFTTIQTLSCFNTTHSLLPLGNTAILTTHPFILAFHLFAWTVIFPFTVPETQPAGPRSMF